MLIADEEQLAPERSSPRAKVFETAAVALAPLLAYLVLRVRIMSPVSIIDESLHSTYIFDPRDMFTRYAAVLAPTARLREAARVSFLIPARLAYLAFGAVPGFVLLRYVLVLGAIGPSYLLLRRLYGRPAGALAVVVILSCPVLITAWGTDYPDSAAVCYLLAGFACLAMPAERRRRMWLALGGAFLTLAVWALAVSIPFVFVALVVYALIRLRRDRHGLLRDIGILGGVAIVVTGLLAVGSYFVIGKVDFITPTVRSILYLERPAEQRLYHSASWAWAPYVKYLLVPPAIVAAWLVTFAGRAKDVPTSQLFVGLTCAGQVVICACLQFFANVEVLEQRFFSSLLWSAVALTLAVTLAELCRSLVRRPVAGWLPAAMVLLVPLGYEMAPHVPRLLGFVGAALAAGLVLAALLGRLLPARRHGFGGMLLISAVVVAIAGPALVLEVAPSVVPSLPGVVKDPPSGFAKALGGNPNRTVDAYRTIAKLRAWVPNAAYSGEQLMMWFVSYLPLRAPVGLFHGYINSLPSVLGRLDPAVRRLIGSRRPAEILFLSRSGEQRFGEALRALAPYRPYVARHAVLRSGDYVLFVWLVQLGEFVR